MEAFNVNFVSVVESHPVLYDFTLTEYARKDVTDKSWRKVAEEVGLSVRECKERWKNLRTAFVRGVKASGSKKKKLYYLHEAMQFILPFTKSNLGDNSQEPEVSDPEDQGSLSTSVDLDPTCYSSPPPVQPDTPIVPHRKTSADNILESSHLPESKSKPIFYPSKRKRPISERGPEEFYVSRRNEVYSKEDKKKSIQAFLKSLVPDLLTLTDPQLRSFKRRTLLIIDEVTGTTPLEYEYETSHLSLSRANLSESPSPASTLPTHYDPSATTVIKEETSP